MLSDNGHLIFTTGTTKEIRFQTAESGRVKVNDEDLSQLLSQVNDHVHLFVLVVRFDSNSIIHTNKRTKQSKTVSNTTTKHRI